MMLLNKTSLHSSFTIKKMVTLFIVLGTIKLNEIKYGNTSIYHVFLVWIGKAIHQALCSKAFLVIAFAALRPRDGVSHPHHF